MNENAEEVKVNLEYFEKMGALNSEIAVPFCTRIARILRPGGGEGREMDVG